MFISSINQARGIYIGRDYDLLISLPIKKSDIVFSKIITLYVIELLFSLGLLVPNGIMVVSLTGDVITMLLAFLLAFFVPIIPLVIASIISLFVTLLTARFKYGNIITALLYFPFILGLSLMGTLFNNSSASMFASIGGVFKWFNPSLILVELAITQSYLYLLLFVVSNLVLLLIAVILFAIFYSKLHDLVTSVKMKASYVRKDLKIKNEFATLLSIDLKRLVNSKMYLLNSLTGAVMTIFAVVICYISTRTIPDIPEAKESFYHIIVPVFITVIMFTLSISNPSCSSISIEGNTFWLSKTLPISLKKYMLSKLCITYIFYIPSSLIASTIVVIFYHHSVLDSVMVYLFPLISVLLVAIIGLIYNVKHPKFKWQNEAEVVKNALPVLFTMLMGMLITIVMGTLVIVGSLLNPLLFYLVGLASLIIVTIICYIYLSKIFEKKIWQMEEL